MRNKIISDGTYIIAAATAANGEDQNAEEIESILQRQPEAPEGQVYRLRADTLEWELTTEESTQSGDIPAEDALSIITGGVT